MLLQVAITKSKEASEIASFFFTRQNFSQASFFNTKCEFSPH